MSTQAALPLPPLDEGADVYETVRNKTKLRKVSTAAANRVSAGWQPLERMDWSMDTFNFLTQYSTS